MSIDLKEEEVNLILKALGELPAKESIAMILRIQREWTEQQEKKSGEK